MTTELEGPPDPMCPKTRADSRGIEVRQIHEMRGKYRIWTQRCKTWPWRMVSSLAEGALDVSGFYDEPKPLDVDKVLQDVSDSFTMNMAKAFIAEAKLL